MNLFKNIAIIIPAFQPSDLLIPLVKTLTHENDSYHVIIVNDGSTGNSCQIFKELSICQNVTVIHHANNMGKGQALKTAFQYYLTHFSDQSPGVVTADADGQHSPDDIKKIAEKLRSSKKEILLGSRQFDTGTPLRSRFGNILSAKIFKLLMRKSLNDTQTGLRGISRPLVSELSHVEGSCYEYELNMLVHAIKNKINMIEIPIKTIYLDGNQSSHFNPLIDSLKIYFVFFRYIFGSLSSACVDFIFFSIIYFFTHYLFLSVASARIISGIFNFIFCKRVVFKSQKSSTSEFIKYASLAVFSMLLSYTLIDAMVENQLFNVYYGKLIADAGIFLMNFTIQRLFIFSLKKEMKE